MQNKRTCIKWTPTASRSAVRRLLCIALGAALFMGAPPARADGSAPRAVVKATTDAVIDILSNKSLSSDEKRKRIEEVVYARVDFDTLCKLVLARNFSRFSPEQQRQFEQEFKRHLSVTYGHNVDNYKNEKTTIIGDREEARGDWTVQSKVIRGGPDDVAVDYRLRQKDGQWYIIDVIVEGVSLVSNFRSQFQEIIANEGPARLIQVLHEKNEKGEPLKS